MISTDGFNRLGFAKERIIELGQNIHNEAWIDKRISKQKKGKGHSG